MEEQIERFKYKVIPKDTLLHLDGSATAFRCRCGSNVFRPVDIGDDKLHYECNGCGDFYTAERVDDAHA